MSAQLITIDLPLAGLDVTDETRDLLPSQAAHLANLRMVGNALESIRGAVPQAGTVPFAGSFFTQDILVYRKKDGTVKYLFAAEGKIFVKDTPDGVATDLGLTVGSPNVRIRLVQAGDWAIILCGSIPFLYIGDGNVYSMENERPTRTPTVSASGGTQTRDYYITYYSPVLDIESNPSDKTTYDACAATTTVQYDTSFDVVQTWFTKIRIYRTGIGITVPRYVGEQNRVAGVNTYSDTSLDEDVAEAAALRFDRTAPGSLSDAVVINNRLFAWGDVNNPSTVWVSNEGEYAYFPQVPFIEKSLAQSGGPIEIRTGDNQQVMSVVPWGGQAIALKQQVSYRLSQSDVGFYSYQHMMNEGTIAGRSPVITGEGLMFLTRRGWMLLTNDESLVDIGAPVKALSDQYLTSFPVYTGTSRGIVFVSYQTLDGNFYLTYIPGQGWQGPHATAVSAFFEDVDGILYGGLVDTAAGFQILLIHYTGVLTSEVQSETLTAAWQTPALDFGQPGVYKRLREVRVVGRELSAGDPQAFLLEVCDDLGTVLHSQTFTFPVNGVAMLGIGNAAHGEFLQLRISGILTRPVRISKVQAFVELLATRRE